LNCSRCGTLLIPRVNAQPKANTYFGSRLCRKCSNARRREAYKNDPVQQAAIKAARLKHETKKKSEVLAYYSHSLVPVCVRCGFADLRALTIDHVNGDGAKERRLIAGENRGRTGQRMYRILRKRGFPAGYQTLCMNCQFIKRVENGEHWKKPVPLRKKEGEGLSEPPQISDGLS